MKFEPHAFTGVVVGKAYCVRCGLIRLNNPITRWCIKKGCNHDEHPAYAATVRRLTK